MPGETNLQVLIKNMQPILHEGEYVFCVIDDESAKRFIPSAICYFKEAEGASLILPKPLAEENNMPYTFTAAWITLTIHSSLEGVGLTAAFANALADEGIGCNVVAAYHHDHIFVAVADVERALLALKKLAAKGKV